MENWPLRAMCWFEWWRFLEYFSKSSQVSSTYGTDFLSKLPSRVHNTHFHLTLLRTSRIDADQGQHSIAFGLIDDETHIILLQKSRIHNWINKQIQYHSLVYPVMYRNLCTGNRQILFFAKLVSCWPDITAYPNMHCCHFHPSPPKSLYNRLSPPPPVPTPPGSPPPHNLCARWKTRGLQLVQGFRQWTWEDRVSGAKKLSVNYRGRNVMLYFEL